MTIADAMDRRVCRPISTQGTVASVIRQLLDENILNPKDAKRTMPFAGFASEAPTSGIISFELTEPKNLREVVAELCALHNLQLEQRGGIVVLTS